MKTYKRKIVKNVRFDCNETVNKDVTLKVDKEFDENCCDNNFWVLVREVHPTGMFEGEKSLI